MNFAAFQQFREHVRTERRDLLDCGATNLYAALARLNPPRVAQSGAGQPTVHRCHLAAEWATAFGFSPEIARRALVSRGVRDSLTRLFRHYGSVDARLWLPEDNYPVFAELAAASQLSLRTFATLPEPIWPDASPVSGPEVLLITNPLKPLGRSLTPQDVAALRTWLAASPERRLIIDAVYTFETRFHPGTIQLFEGSQTIVLHSLTKGWLQPRLLGIALVPEADVARLAPGFRADPPPQENLAFGRHLLARHAGLPGLVRAEIESARQRMSEQLRSQFATGTALDAAGYFIPIAARWSDLLRDADVLGLPATVFGSRRDDLTILSCLSFIP